MLQKFHLMCQKNGTKISIRKNKFASSVEPFTTFWSTFEYHSASLPHTHTHAQYIERSPEYKWNAIVAKKTFIQERKKEQVDQLKRGSKNKRWF